MKENKGNRVGSLTGTRRTTEPPLPVIENRLDAGFLPPSSTLHLLSLLALSYPIVSLSISLSPRRHTATRRWWWSTVSIREGKQVCVCGGGGVLCR
ncbi:hypothetical protein HanPSC8_Chr17g0750631 [Helianthus annuus]|nr:hypothetical protein HanPSC8_Chr17g0750631 [Helianthus annuus]